MAKKTTVVARVAALVDLLIDETKSGALVWKDEGPLGLFTAERAGVQYLLDNPRNGSPELLVDSVLVWRGPELTELRRWIIAQQERLHSVLPVNQQHPNSNVGRVLDRTLKTFKK